MLAVGAGSCGFLGGGADESVLIEPQPIGVPSPTDVVGQAPAGIEPSPVTDETLAEGETDAEAENPDEAEPLGAAIGVNGLIPSTDSTARLRAIQLGRPDPFAAVPVAPRVTVTGTGATGAGATGGGNTTTVPPLPRARALPQAPQRTTPSPTAPRTRRARRAG
ncbi:MAG: hypothetical protein HC838_12755 [Spirulinaceae cyanobacterium RM2_2_10]|nr:hypothetical protein [Spirulinaceae cyanobacterium RM2_2_10]